MSGSRRHPPTARFLAQLARHGLHRELVWTAALAPLPACALVTYLAWPGLLQAGHHAWQCAMISAQANPLQCLHGSSLASPSPVEILASTIVAATALALAALLVASIATAALRSFVRLRETPEPRWTPHLWICAVLALAWGNSWPQAPTAYHIAAVVVSTVIVDLLLAQLVWHRANRMSDEQRRREAREQQPSPHAQRLLRSSMGSRPTRDPSHR